MLADSLTQPKSPSTGAEISYLGGLDAYSEWILGTLPRTDQRRWGAAYLAGLLTLPGRKSIRRMAESVAGGNVEQSLQQFVNQSPWDWRPVRARLSETARPLVRPRAWAVDEVAFPKNGDRSVAVARQFAAPLGKVANCQVGMALSAVGEHLSCPVGWRLMLPPCWDADESRRAPAGVPAHERHRPRAHEILGLLDEMADACTLGTTPVLVDARGEIDPEPLLRGLERRGLSYLVQVAPTARVADRGAGAGPRPALPSAPVGVIATSTARRGQIFLRWQRGPGEPWRRSRFAAGPLAASGPRPAVPTLRPGRREVLAEWCAGERLPRGCWITNLRAQRVPDLVGLATTAWRSRAALGVLERDFGLQHFEGRSYRGWHHHVTLVSASYLYDRLMAGADTRVPAHLPR